MANRGTRKQLPLFLHHLGNILQHHVEKKLQQGSGGALCPHARSLSPELTSSQLAGTVKTISYLHLSFLSTEPVSDFLPGKATLARLIPPPDDKHPPLHSSFVYNFRPCCVSSLSDLICSVCLCFLTAVMPLLNPLFFHLKHLFTCPPASIYPSVGLYLLLFEESTLAKCLLNLNSTSGPSVFCIF